MCENATSGSLRDVPAVQEVYPKLGISNLMFAE
jgi:hypothetical protein